MKISRYIFIIVAAVVAGLMISACNSSVESEKPKSETAKTETEIKKDKPGNGLEIGAKSPSFELTTVKGDKISDETLKGKPAVLVFWSVYCSKCKKETPKINELAKGFSSKGVEVIGINTGESDKEIKEGIESFGIEYAVAPDQNKQIMQKFGASGTPTIVFLDKEGNVQYFGNKLPEDYSERLISLI